jgi:hypothetical protein
MFIRALRLSSQSLSLSGIEERPSKKEKVLMQRPSFPAAKPDAKQSVLPNWTNRALCDDGRKERNLLFKETIQAFVKQNDFQGAFNYAKLFKDPVTRWVLCEEIVSSLKEKQSKSLKQTVGLLMAFSKEELLDDFQKTKRRECLTELANILLRDVRCGYFFFQKEIIRKIDDPALKSQLLYELIAFLVDQRRNDAFLIQVLMMEIKDPDVQKLAEEKAGEILSAAKENSEVRSSEK